MAAKLKFTLKPFSEVTFGATKTSWLKRVTGAFSFPTEVPQLLEYAATRLDIHAGTDVVFYGLFKEGTDVASAVAEITVTRKSARSRWMKMLRVRLSPELEEGVYNNSIEALKDIQALYVGAVAGVLRLKFEHDATILKIYGRSNEQMSFLKLVSTELEKLVKNHKISIEGRWLVIENDA